MLWRLNISGKIKSRMNIFFMIVPQKVLKAAEAFVTTVQRRNPEKNLNQPIVPLIRLLQWVLKNFYRSAIPGIAATGIF